MLHFLIKLFQLLPYYNTIPTLLLKFLLSIVSLLSLPLLDPYLILSYHRVLLLDGYLVYVIYWLNFVYKNKRPLINNVETFGTPGYGILGHLIAKRYISWLKESRLNPLLAYNTKDVSLLTVHVSMLYYKIPGDLFLPSIQMAKLNRRIIPLSFLLHQALIHNILSLLLLSMISIMSFAKNLKITPLLVWTDGDHMN